MADRIKGFGRMENKMEKAFIRAQMELKEKVNGKMVKK